MQHNTVKISAVIITYNEEKNIERCLASLQNLADEILVVDSYSTDRTEEICLTYNVKFIKNTFVGHIEQKNFAMLKASHDIILSLDADEALDETLYTSIVNVKDNWEKDGYRFNRLTNYCGKWIRHGDWYPDTKLRLWDKRKGKWEGSNPHDYVKLVSEATSKNLKGDILHYSYYSIKQHIDQVNYFTDIMAQESFKRGKNSSYFKIIVSPFFKFFKTYFIKFGFLDGFYGFVVCMISAHATFVKHIKIRQHFKYR